MMNSRIGIWIAVIVALVIGVIIGFLLFDGAQSNSISAEHNHEVEPIQTSNDGIWTCSMHPQIRQNEPGDCPICGMDLIPLSENTSSDPLVLEMTSESVKLANIQTTIIGETSAKSNKTLRLSGKVQPDERLAASQVAHVPGRIEKLLISFTGEQVSKGQKIATLYSPDLITAQRELLEALKLKDLNADLVESARNKLRYWKISNDVISEVEKQGRIQETFPVYADESGIVIKKRVAIGDYVNQGDVLFELMNLRKVWVLFDAYEEDLSNISIGDRIEFTTPALPSQTFRTRVTFIDPMINPKSRVAAVRTEVSNGQGLLKPEMLVYGTLEESTRDLEQLTVPKSAVMWTGVRSVVYVKVPEVQIPSFEFREIEIGEAVSDHYLVIDGLQSGEEVVTNGSFTIDAAAQLNNQASMMNREIGLKGLDESTDFPDHTAGTPPLFKEQLFDLTTSYLVLKDALVASDDAQAKKAADALTTELKKVDMSLVQGEAHIYWMDQQNAIRAHASEIASTQDIVEQRRQFDFLSQVLIKSVKSFGIGEEKLFVQHCPMANNDEGADWLSNVEEILNPYFGDKMLKCGFIQDTIKLATADSNL